MMTVVCLNPCLDKTIHVNTFVPGGTNRAVSETLVAGGKDHVVPYDENGLPFSQRFEAAGGKLLMIVKPECDHHPHSLDDPAPVTEFLMNEE